MGTEKTLNTSCLSQRNVWGKTEHSECGGVGGSRTVTGSAEMDQAVGEVL